MYGLIGRMEAREGERERLIGILLLAGHELRTHPEVPYRVVINEAIELAKAFGGTDGHKYVNGVLDRMAAQLRAAEIQAR